MRIGIISVRKQWNNAPSFLIEGLKTGIRELLFDNYNFQDIDFTFLYFTIHTPNKLYINPEDVKDFDIIIIPFWIGERILNCNLSELKEKLNIIICTYSGHAVYARKPTFDFDLTNKKILKGELIDYQFNNLNCIDKFFVIKKVYPFDKEIEIGCGYFPWTYPNKSKETGMVLDFCKENWDETVWHDFSEIWNEIYDKYNIRLIQLGTYPLKLKNCAIFDRPFVHYRKLCKLYSKIKIFISMNESFGYPVMENLLAGNIILVHDKIEIPNFYFKSSYIISWNKTNLMDKLDNIIKTYDDNLPLKIRNEFMSLNLNFFSWKDTVKKLVNELQKF